MKKIKINNKINELIILSIILILFVYYAKLKNKNEENYITLVTALYQLPTNRHNFSDYFIWIENFLKVNKPIVFYIQKNLSQIIKKKRPKIFSNKTIFIEKNFSKLYFSKYKKEFEETYKIDKLKFKHNVQLFILWNEKIKFLELAIKKNYFKSKYFLWIDAGYFRNKDVTNYINNWPAVNKCKQDPRVIINEVRKITKEEFDKLMSFDEKAHRKFQNEPNTLANAFGGRIDYLLKFINLYYKIFQLFIKKKLFIGSEQNFYSILGHQHPEIIKFIQSTSYDALKNYYLDNNYILNLLMNHILWL